MTPDSSPPDSFTTFERDATGARVTTDEFLNAIFRSPEGVIVTANAEEYFKRRRYKPGTKLDGKFYFCISTVQDKPRASLLKGRTQDLVKTYVIVLDDVGTKVDPAMVKAMPSYKLETSLGNQQWGYIFEDGVDPGRAAALIVALADAGLTDKGAKRADRIMRVPGSLNDKYGEPFYARLIEWNPDRTYTFSELASRLGVTPTGTAKLPVFRPLEHGESDPVFEWLSERGHIISGPDPRGWYSMHCPWEGEHTVGVEHGTGYWPGNSGAFKCLHGHCADRNTAALKQWIKERDPTSDIDVISQRKIKKWTSSLSSALSPYRFEPRKTMFGSVMQIDRESMTLVQQLVHALPEVRPEQLPNPDRTANTKVSTSQAVTAPRVHEVMLRIGMSARMNALTGSVEYDFPYCDFYSPNDPTNAAIDALVHMCAVAGMKRGRDMIVDAAFNFALRNSYSPVTEWIESVTWDGVDRLSSLYETITMEDPRYNRWRDAALRRWLLQTSAVTSNWRLGMSALPAEGMLILQGAQGIGKTRWICRLMPNDFVGYGLTLRLEWNERDAVRRVTRYAIAEFAEIDGTFRREQAAAMKAFITRGVDTFRPPYGKNEISLPRCMSPAGTTNSKGFLHDETGERRFWVLAVKHCKFDHDIDMQQVFAQLKVMRDQDAEPFYLLPHEVEMQRDAAERHKAPTAFTDMVDQFVMLRQQYPDKTYWKRVNAKELAQRFDLAQRGNPHVYNEIYTLLEAAGFERGKSGREYILVPPFRPTEVAPLVGLHRPSEKEIVTPIRRRRPRVCTP